MPDGSINIPGTVQLNGPIDATKARLNITANRAFLNSAAVPLLNTTGIIALYNIYYTTPIASVDWADTGAIIHCPTSICTNISYSGNVFVFNVTHFTSYSAANDTVIINSTIIDSNISNCTIINSTVINSTKTNCTIINSYIINSTNNNTVIIDTNETNSLDNDTVVDDSIIIGSVKINSTINGSTKVNSTIINSNVINSTNYNSTIINTNETNSTDNDSVVDYSTIIGSIKINSTINGSIKIGSNITNSHIINSNNTNSTVINTNETNSTDINSTVDNSIIIGTIKINSNINGSNITNSTINSTVVINSTINSSNLTNCTVTNSTLNGINNQSCNYTNFNGSFPAPVPPGPSGGGGGGGGGGIGGVRRNLTQPVSGGGQNLCIESWACEDWTKCENSVQTRGCVDVRACGTATLKPATQRTCTMQVIEPEKPVEVTRPEIAAPEQLVFPEEKPGIMARIGSVAVKSLGLFKAYLWPIIFVILGILLLTGAYIAVTHYKKPEEAQEPAEEPVKITSIRAPISSGKDTEELLGSLKSSGDALADFEKAMRKLRK
jgi:hypothetical protein